jgi:hypothetical protein
MAMTSLAGERAVVGRERAVGRIDHERGRSEPHVRETPHQVRTGTGALTVAEACAVALGVRRERQILAGGSGVRRAGHAGAMDFESAQGTAAVGINAAEPVHGLPGAPRFFARVGRLVRACRALGERERQRRGGALVLFGFERRISGGLLIGL